MILSIHLISTSLSVGLATDLGGSNSPTTAARDVDPGPHACCTSDLEFVSGSPSGLNFALTVFPPLFLI